MTWVRLDISAVPSGWSIVCSCGSMLDAETSGGLLLAIRTHLEEHLGPDADDLELPSTGYTARGVSLP